ncbi:MAG: nicotinate phosphoribosyltransferase, partial [Buchnera aphidicola]|nr:nicotinate phosphoribosyltransferase [Buchnera aphidicola]
ICRGDNFLGSYANVILEQINMMTNLSLSHKEYVYMASFSLFQKEYLFYLKNFRYNLSQITVKNQAGKLYIRISGLWKDVILWEVPILAIVSEVFHSHSSPKITPQCAIRFLDSKLFNFFHYTKHLDLSRLKVVDFGTRRRFSYDIHYSILTRLKEKFPYLIGSSNYHISHTLNILPLGTQAHEWFQAHQQISSNLRNSQILALKRWLDQYQNQLSIALTDCISIDSFLRDFNFSLANLYKGLRHDSGNPVIWGEKVIRHYKNLGIDPLTKTLLFSDNLNFSTIASLYNQFNTRVNLIFGIGTQLTCDIPNVRPLNIVIKLAKCNGRPVAKLSDSPGKQFCLDKKFLKRICKVF